MRLGRVTRRIMSWFAHHNPRPEPEQPPQRPCPECPSAEDSPEYQEVRRRQHAARNMVQRADNIIDENTSDEVRDAVLHHQFESKYRSVLERERGADA